VLENGQKSKKITNSERSEASLQLFCRLFSDQQQRRSFGRPESWRLRMTDHFDEGSNSDS